jgi:hypothetical protein
MSSGTFRVLVIPGIRCKDQDRRARCGHSHLLKLEAVQVDFCLRDKQEDQLPPLALQRFRTHPPGHRLCPRCGMPTLIYHPCKAFDINSNVGWACRKIVTLKGEYSVNLLNPLVASQNIEYKMSNVLDKHSKAFSVTLPTPLHCHPEGGIRQRHSPLQVYPQREYGQYIHRQVPRRGSYPP